VWDLESGRALAALEGHASRVLACVVTPDGRRVVSASDDKTLKVWDLATYACLFTHRGDAPYLAVAADTAGVVAGDSTGGIWFLDWPPSERRATQLDIGNRENRQRESRPAQETSVSRPTMKKHTILFLAANPTGTSPLALGEEVRAIQAELERSGYRDCFALETRWAAQPLDLLRELRRLKPTVVHFSGHGGPSPVGTRATSRAPSRDVSADAGPYDNEPQRGLFFQGPDGRAQVVTAQALDETFSAAGSSVKLVILSACYSDMQAEALRAHVDCVVGMSGSIVDDAARNFAIGFYGGLGERESIAAAFRQGCAAISLEGFRDSDRPQLRVRDGVDASKLVLGFPRRVEAHDTGAVGVQPQTHRTSGSGPSTFVHKVDIGILTIRDDEFRAVLDAFPQKAGAGVHKGANRHYILRHAEVATGERYTIAILRQVEQGTGEAQHAARDLIDDLAPKLVLVVGTAGGLPSDDVTLGDVVLGTRIHDYTVEAVKTGHEVTYAAAGGPIDQAIAAAVVALAGREDELGDWTAGLPSQPAVAWTEEGQVYGPPEWQRELRAKLEHHFAGGASHRAPTYMSGAIASSDRLVKDPTVLFPWITTARNLLAVEMESGGVYRAARERCPMLAIRGISDIVGLKRADAWTKFACASAAAFARAFLRTQPVPAGASLSAADPL
jgi:nucleoside phosphorylase